jgi:methyl-accepting chemotaxis protein
MTTEEIVALPSEAKRLQSAQSFDKWGFSIAFVSGAVVILGGKAAGMPQWSVTAVAIGIMLGYAVLVWRATRLRLRADQAGDNCYYLGLLYTLVSLGWALYAFDTNIGAAQVIGNFGVALGSTIVGLMLRVFFSQTRQDLVEIETEMRVELAAAGNRVRTELDQVVATMNDFGRVMQQSIKEAFDGMRANVVSLADESMKSLTEVSGNASTGLEKAFGSLDGYATQFAAAATTMVEAIDSHTAALSRISEGAHVLDAQMAALSKVATEAERGMNALTKKTTDIQSAQNAMKEAATAARELTQQHTKALEALEASVSSVTAKLGGTMDLWDKRLAAASEGISSDTAMAAKSFEDSVDRLREQHAEALGQLNGALNQATQAIRVHATELASELGKSRTYTSQVHTALVEMSADLVAKVEGITVGGSSAAPPST